MMLANGDGLRQRRNLAYQRSWLGFGGECQRGFDFSVPGKVPGVGQVKSTAGWIKTEVSLLGSLQRTGNLMSIAQKERGGVDQRPIAFFGADFKSPQSRFRESVLHRASFVSVVAVRAVTIVRCDQKHARPGPFKTHDIALSQLAAIQTDII